MDTKQMQAAVDELKAAGFTVTPKAPIAPGIKSRAVQLFDYTLYARRPRDEADVQDSLADARDEAIRAVHAAYYTALVWQSGRK